MELKIPKSYSIKIGKSARELNLECVGLKKTDNGILLLNNEQMLSKGVKIEYTINNDEEYKTYIINNYSKIVKSGFICKEFKCNITTKYILPILFEDKTSILYDHNLINGYIKCNKYHGEFTGDLIHLVFRYYPFKYYSTIIDYLKTLKSNTIEFIDCGKSKDGRFDILSFMIKSKLNSSELRKIINGKYNKITEYSKNKILKFHNLDVNSNLAGELFNTEKYMLKHCNKYGITIKDIPSDFNFKKKPIMEDEIWLND